MATCPMCLRSIPSTGLNEHVAGCTGRPAPATPSPAYRGFTGQEPVLQRLSREGRLGKALDHSTGDHR